jgi:hypothetical protein
MVCFEKEVFFEKECFSSILEFKSKMLFFLTLKKWSHNSKFCCEKHRFCIDNTRPWTEIQLAVTVFSSKRFFHWKSQSPRLGKDGFSAARHLIFSSLRT